MVFFNLILFFKKSVFHLTFSKHENKMPCGKRVPFRSPPAPPRRPGQKKRIPVQELKSRLFSFSFLLARIFWGLIRLLGQKKRIALQEFKIDSAESGVLR